MTFKIATIFLFSAFLAAPLAANELMPQALNSQPVTEQMPETAAKEATKSITDFLPVDVLIEQGTSALYNHNYDFARKLFNLAAEKDREYQAQAIFVEAIIHSQRGQFQQSLQKLNLVTQLNDDYDKLADSLKAPLLLNLAELSLQDKNYAKATSLLNAFDSTSLRDTALEERYQRLKNNKGLHTPLKQPLRIGVLMPLSGKAKHVGESILNAMQLKLFHSSLSEIRLFPVDTKGTEEGAQQAYQRLLNQGVDLIIGPLLSKNTKAIAPYAKASGRPLISFSTDTSAAKENTYLLSYIPEDQAIIMARHAAESGKSRVAILAPDSIYGIRMARQFEKEANKLGLTVIPPVYFERNSVDITEALRKVTQYDKAKKELETEKAALEKEYNLLKESLDDEKLNRLKELEKAEVQPLIEFDAIFMPASAQSMPLLAPQLAFHDINPKNVLILGTAQWDDASILKNKGEYLRGARFPASPLAPKLQFEKAYTATYLEPAHPIAILGYQVLELIEQRLAEGATNAYDITTGLTRQEGFKGVTGTFKFNQQGINQRLYDIRQIAYDKTVTFQQAPMLFPPAIPSRLKPGWSWRF